ncbi:CpaF family protein [Desulfohalovibrio reitneri]|uniref:CpaF family protein n=1 Tax=Desulfohalovibrio reitneri TaxID=1307759 RepID=UPI0004A6E646|nr:CpaF family protein [Desulfohalovibrio reitneri]
MDLATRLSKSKARRSSGDLREQAGGENRAPMRPASRKGRDDEREAAERFFDLKTKIHDRLIDLLDLSILDDLPTDEVRGEIARAVERILREDFGRAPLSAQERLNLISEVQDEVLGLGPLEPFLKDETVNDILVNTYRQIFVERGGRLELAQARFKDDGHLRKIIDRIVSQVGRRVDESSPMVDARLLDGSRVNAIIPPLALDGPSLSIRKFSKDPLELDDLISFKAIPPQMGEVLKAIVRSRLNVVISGGTGSGKTTLLNVLSRFIPREERIVTIEDAAELQLKQVHVVRLETRPANIEGRGEVTQRDLVKNCLRMRPDRIIVGEVRSSEALDMLQAMNTGHDGSLTTVHANSPRDALMRLETMVSMAGMNLPTLAMRRFISSAVDVIIQATRLADGTRKVISFQEVTGMEGEMITMQEIFSFEQTGVDAEGKVQGHFRTVGVRPMFADKLASMGAKLPENIFNPGKLDV